MKKTFNILKSKYFLIILYVVIIIIAIQFILKIYPRLHPLSQTSFQINREEIIEKAKNLIEGDFPEEELEFKVSFIIDKKHFENSQILKDQKLTDIPPFDRFWEISMISEKNKKPSFTLSSDSESEQSKRDSSGDWYIAQISPAGSILKLDFENAREALYADSSLIIDSERTPDRESRKQALNQARHFLNNIGVDTFGLQLQVRAGEVKIDKSGKIFNIFLSKKVQLPRISHNLKISPSGTVYYYEKKIEFERPEPEKSGVAKVAEIVAIIFEIGTYLGLFILIIYFSIYFARKESISFKIALPFVYFIGAITLLKELFEVWGSSLVMILLGTFPTAIFYAIGIFFLYAVSDSLARQQWSEKLSVSDQFLQGGFLTARTSKSLLRGLILGILAISAYVLPLFIYTNYFGGIIQIEENFNYSLSVLFPILVIILSSINIAIFSEFFFRLFGISLLKKWLRKNYRVILSGIIFAFVFTTELKTTNHAVNIFLTAGPALLFAYFFVRHEIVTAILGYFTYQVLSKAVIFSQTGEPLFHEIGIGLYLILGALATVGLVTIILRRGVEETGTGYVPEYIRKSEERERLIRELDIARNVQLRFLPHLTPQITNYEIAAICQPAWEVGGDYYDYFPIEENQLGIVIGDVSNKGVSAAFYMTLVKGFLKALAIHHKRPAEILSQANRLFHENVARGHFISMVLGILNSKSGEFIFARAGHNPVLLLFGKTKEGKWLIPQGAGIGILPDNNFRSTIKEEKIQLNQGDILVLYTDGYPEAMNEKSEEFGETTLQELIEEKRGLPAKKIIQELENAIAKWEGKRPSIDDRTIVIIKRIK
jgi:sigma-B regulation protein RsbU (phosphoserine phosphatase)